MDPITTDKITVADFAMKQIVNEGQKSVTRLILYLKFYF